MNVIVIEVFYLSCSMTHYCTETTKHAGQVQLIKHLRKQQQANKTQISFASACKTTPITPNLKYRGVKIFLRFMSACVF